MADELGDAVRLNAAVRSITQAGDRVVVDSGDVVVSAPHAVVAVPPALALEIAFDPVLPDDRLTLYRNDVGGPETKTLVVYDDAVLAGRRVQRPDLRAATRPPR